MSSPWVKPKLLVDSCKGRIERAFPGGGNNEILVYLKFPNTFKWVLYHQLYTYRLQKRLAHEIKFSLKWFGSFSSAFDFLFRDIILPLVYMSEICGTIKG